LHRNCLLKHVIEEQIERMRRGERRLMQLLYKLQENRRYWKMKEERVDRTVWRTGFRGGYGTVVR
jgi:hypothetical protein